MTKQGSPVGFFTEAEAHALNLWVDAVVDAQFTCICFLVEELTQERLAEEQFEFVPWWALWATKGFARTCATGSWFRLD